MTTARTSPRCPSLQAASLPITSVINGTPPCPQQPSAYCGCPRHRASNQASQSGVECTELHADGEPAIGARLERGFAAVGAGDRRHDGKPEAGAVGVACPDGCQALERPVQPADLLRREAWAALRCTRR